MLNYYNYLDSCKNTRPKKRDGMPIGSPPTNSQKTTGRKAWSLFATALFFLFMGLNASAQTILIDPAGDGGFENGATFASNGWTVSNFADSVNKWVVGTAVTGAPYAGKTAYISVDSGTTNT
jgi:hypothetical protein